ncbi:MAG: endonuclease III [Acidaminococcaceae bacterium]
MRKEQREAIIATLETAYAGVETALHYNSAFELLVAVIMSAQCTDERVNKITARIFPAYNTPEKMGALGQAEMEQLIHDCGLFRAKAKNLLGTCHKLVADYGSVVPDNVETLMTLPGVGRKTANVIASIIYGVPAIAVDTHVFRVAHRLGLAKGSDPLSVEKELMKVLPQAKWSAAHHWLIWHGRRLCKARKPLCQECMLLTLCPFKEKSN